MNYDAKIEELTFYGFKDCRVGMSDDKFTLSYAQLDGLTDNELYEFLSEVEVFRKLE
jgi:hypothetical protein